MLELENINVYYGPIHALKEVSLVVNEGEIVSLIGANGAGKTSTLKTISGLLRPRSGTMRFKGHNITFSPAQDVVRLGISQVPEGRRVFPDMTVQENLEMGAFLRRDKKEISQDFARVFERFPRLEERRKQFAGTLSGGEQQMLVIGRAVMAKPSLLLLDEPSMGLAPLLVREIFDIIKDINQQGTTILLVEQNARMALSIANQAYVLETGSIVLQGEASKLLESDQVKRAYLGG
ncbi:MAG: ABC transporter ATP-binding protein [Syntrophomonadaceae bacterium]|nr:ABC transporter ATP-binding protein [Syntrophomonadaceae bacterium]